MVRVFTRILSVPTSIGVYAVHSTTFDLFLMIGIGICGYILRKLDYSLSAVLLGFILGGMMEENLRRALSLSNGELGILWGSPIALAVWALVAVMVALPVWRAWRARQGRNSAVADSRA